MYIYNISPHSWTNKLFFVDFNTMGRKMYAWTVDCLWVCWRCLNWIYRIWSTYIFIISFLNIYMQIGKDATHIFWWNIYFYFSSFFMHIFNAWIQIFISMVGILKMDLNLSIKLLISWTNNKSKHHFPLFPFILLGIFFHWKKYILFPHFNLSFLFIDKI